MELTLHIGKEKTGTKTLQYFMHENSEEILNQGIYYPEFPWGAGYSHNAIAGYITQADESCAFYKNNGFLSPAAIAGFKLDFKSFFEKKLAKQRSVKKWVISAEHLSYLPEHAVRALHSFLSTYFSKI